MPSCRRASARRFAGWPNPSRNAPLPGRSRQPPSTDLSQLIDVDQSVLTVEGQRHCPAAIRTDSADLQIGGMVDGEFGVRLDNQPAQLAKKRIASAIL